jgi:hypothetical protein
MDSNFVGDVYGSERAWLARLDAPSTLGHIAMWFQFAADALAAGDDDVVHCVAVAFVAVVRGNPEARDLIRRGLDLAQRTDLGHADHEPPL